MLRLTSIRALLVLSGALLFSMPLREAHAACPPGTPADAIEPANRLTGNPASEWDVTGAGGLDLQGFATDTQRQPRRDGLVQGEHAATGYRIDIHPRCSTDSGGA